MNFLAHLYLADDTEASLIGNFLGDFVKGPVEELGRRHEPEIVRGLLTHRRVDAFTDAHPAFRAAKRLVSPARRRFAGILVDVWFDHFLARHWRRYADVELETFIARVYGVFARNLHRFPAAAAPRVRRMIEQDWLAAYRTVDGVGAILDRMAVHRVRRGGVLAGAGEELIAHYRELEIAFARFFPEVIDHVRARAAEPGGGEPSFRTREDAGTRGGVQRRLPR